MRYLNRQSVYGAVAGALLVAGLVAAQPGISQTVRRSTTLTDEDRAIAAVRSAKASVVNIVGNNRQGVAQVNGTGFIVDPNGFIVSNSHVVDDNSANFSYQVIFQNGKKYDAKVLGVDTYNDIALLKIEATGLPVIKYGNSDALETGQTVFAIGNSLGKYQNTVTRGVVSGTARDIALGTVANPRPRLQNLIQTDAAINPGNSGGPLINMSGEVIGMNTLIDTAGQGLGFAVPFNVVKDAAHQIRTTGRTSRAYLGVSYQTIDAALQASLNLNSGYGAYILQVANGGPAAQAGLRRGDIVLKINNTALSEQLQLDTMVQKFQAGNQIMVQLMRGSETIDLPLILGEFK